ncbi:uncharacterized protein [Paramisgurnus dabryanus]|uniref:uncharacterized protein isoform X2 n=1 Tax=Paramisgurnus dabryanus TaxID=90735 RepID=UPI0031F36351
MKYSERVAIWLLALSVHIIQACAYCARLEMISVWLLFLKLLRATAGVRRSNGSELNEGKPSVNQQQQEQEHVSEAVTMETSQLSEMADITDCKMDSGYAEDQKCQFSEEEEKEEEEKECFATECLEPTKLHSEEDMDESKGITNECEGSGESDGSTVSQESILVKVSEQEQSNFTESLNSESYDNSEPEKEQELNISNDSQEKKHSEAEEKVDALEKSVLEEQINELTISEVLSESCQDVDRDDLSDCLHVEMAIISSDSDVEEQWRPTVDKEQIKENGELEPNVNSEDQAMQKDKAVTESNAEPEDGDTNMNISKSDILEERPEYPTECENVTESNAEPEDGDTDMKISESDILEQPGYSTEFENVTESNTKLEDGDTDMNISKRDIREQRKYPTECENVTESNAEPEDGNTDVKICESDILEQPEYPTECENVTESNAEPEDGDTDMNIAESDILEQSENPTECENVTESNAEPEDTDMKISESDILEQPEYPTECENVTERNTQPEDVDIDVKISESDILEQPRYPIECQNVTESNAELEDGDTDMKISESDILEQPVYPTECENVTESNTEPEDTDVNISEGDILEQPEYPTECELQDISLDSSAHYCSLTEIPEDEGELVKSSMHNLQRLSCSTSELDKKLPQDFCVVQEIKSENVSTEHLDFRVARQQWQKMEEQTKGQVHRPMLRHGPCQGGHSFMYTPVRNIDRLRKDPDTESLSLGDCPHTQFSPCSEDSGLDVTSYRSPYDEPETPVEREIREALEREENFRHERAKVKASAGEATQVKPKPCAIPHSRSEPGERGRMFNTPEDRCRSQRSSSAKTPTFSIPASSAPTYHEMTANNVIILEPDSYPTSPRNRGKGSLLSPGTSSFQEWPADTNNVIILETSNLIIRSASEFCLSTACQETQESTFHNNPFFKLRSHSTLSLVDQEIKIVRQREEELRRQRAQLYAKERYDTVLVSPSQLQNFSYDRPGEAPTKSKSSPSSPSKTRRMDRSTLSCDNKFYR